MVVLSRVLLFACALYSASATSPHSGMLEVSARTGFKTVDRDGPSEEEDDDDTSSEEEQEEGEDPDAAKKGVQDNDAGAEDEEEAQADTRPLSGCELDEQDGVKPMLRKLQTCVKDLITFGDVTEKGMQDSRVANKEYIHEFMAVNEELKKMRENKDLAEAFAEDNTAAYKVLSGKLDAVEKQIKDLAGQE